MKNKNKIIIGTMSMTLVFSIFYASSSLEGKRVLPNIAITDPYTLTLDDSNGISGSNLTTTLSQYTDRGHYAVDFNYEDCSTLVNGHCVINQNGTLRNKDIIHSIEGIQATFTTGGFLKFRTSYDAETWGSYCTMENGFYYSLPSEPYYIEFTASDSYVNVTQIKYSYTCEDNDASLPQGSGTWKLVTSTDDLIIDDKYIIAASTANYAMSTTQGSSNRSAVAITKNTKDNTISTPSNSVCQFELKRGSSEGKYSFYDSAKEGYIYTKSSTSSGSLLTETTKSANSSYTISITTAGVATLTSGSSPYNKVLYYNKKTSRYFNVYSSTSASNTSSLALYHYDEPKVSKPSDEVGFTAVDDKADNYSIGDVYNASNQLTVTAIYSDGNNVALDSSKYSIGIKNSANQAVNPGSAFTESGYYTVTVSYKNYIPVQFNIAVAIVIPTNLTASLTTTTYAKGQTLDISTLKANISYNNGSSTNNIAYANFGNYNLLVKLLNPASVETSLNSTLNEVGTWTLRIEFTEYSNVCANISITVQAIDDPVPSVWTKVTSTSGLTAGAHYVIAIQGIYIVTTNVSNGYILPESCEANSDYSKITGLSENTAIFTLSGSSTAWTFTNQNNKALGTSAEGVVAYGSGTTTWKISFQNGSAYMQSTNTSYGYFLFEQDPYVGFTTNTSSGYLIQIYKETEVAAQYATSISLNTNSASIFTGSFVELSVNYSPSTTNQHRVMWSSNNPSVASVDEYGTVTANSKGSASITAKYETKTGYLTANCSITVNDPVTYSTETQMSSNISNFVNNNRYDLDNAPSTGSAKLLIIPVWFTDSGSYISNSNKSRVKNDIEKAYLGTNSDTGWRSVKTYYEEESHGKLSISGVVTDWYQPGKASSSYTDSTTTSTLVKNASDWYFNQTGASRKSFDCDGNGHLDGVMLIYAAPDSSAYDMGNDNLWAYCYWIQGRNSNTSSPTPNVFFWASYDFMYGAGDTNITSYYGGDTSNCSIDTHTFIHEMGHVFGLEDYYDYSYQFNPAGGFSMQDMNVGGHDPYSCLQLGWANAIIPTQSSRITLDAFQDSGDVVLLTPSWNSYNSPFDEYLLVELYTPTGLNEFDSLYSYSGGYYPQGPSIPGIRLWHVDARLLYKTSSSGSYSESYITSDPSKSYLEKLCSNTYYTSDTSGRCSPLCTGSSSPYGYYNELQLIRDDGNYASFRYDYMPGYSISEYELFTAGEGFNMTKEAAQFYNSGKLNSGKALGWSFSVEYVSNSQAVISVYKY